MGLFGFEFHADFVPLDLAVLVLHCAEQAGVPVLAQHGESAVALFRGADVHGGDNVLELLVQLLLGRQVLGKGCGGLLVARECVTFPGCPAHFVAGGGFGFGVVGAGAGRLVAGWASRGWGRRGGGGGQLVA